jgi:redox-sensitive bicupin YhaK (pirin superfamily)
MSSTDAQAPQSPLPCPPDEPVLHPRTVERLVVGEPTSDGAGVKLTRVLTHNLQRRLDPFLMLDAFGSDQPGDYIAGFPDHPHRGFETITYMIAGRMQHRDSAGNEGLLDNGGVQWMTAGRGVVHAEIPMQTEGRMEGFQLWLNLPSDDKLCAPWYRDFTADDLPRFRTREGVEVVVIAGASHGISGAVQRPRTLPLYLDVHLPAGSTFEQVLPAAHNALVYVYRGELSVGQDTDVEGAFQPAPLVGAGRMAILRNSSGFDGLRLRAMGADVARPEDGVRALVIAGHPLREPIAQYGPFVMNTHQEVFQAVADFQAGRLV